MALSMLSKKGKLTFYVLIAFILCILFYRVIVCPIGRKMTSLNKEIVLEQENIERSLRRIKQKEEITDEYKKYANYVRKGFVSDEEESAILLKKIENIARQTGVYIADLKPYPPKKIDFYRKYSVGIEIEAEMPQFIDFIYRLRSSSKLLRVESFQINPKGGDSLLLKGFLLITELIIF